MSYTTQVDLMIPLPVRSTKRLHFLQYEDNCQTGFRIVAICSTGDATNVMMNIDLRDNFNSGGNACAISEHEIPSFKTAALHSIDLGIGTELGASICPSCDRTAVMAKKMIKYISNILRKLVSLLRDSDD